MLYIFHIVSSFLNVNVIETYSYRMNDTTIISFQFILPYILLALLLGAVILIYKKLKKHRH